MALTLPKLPEPRPPIQTILNPLWKEANRPAIRWKRKAAILAALAGSIVGGVG
jgi:hypothetical protein